ncbi:AGAP009853-PA-like protein [Anopheles sinensis]|uniref:Gustatory receptor n=1 Tax=Anopheles sinensis TaxID=74873 RepID=A0A084W8X6_ANOSI|nr:AGAP009853-PA-like protein [Anopheles sinensis]
MVMWQRWTVLSTYVRFYQWAGFLPYRLENGKITPFLAVAFVKCVLVWINLGLIFHGRECILYHCEWLGKAVDVIKLLTIFMTEVVMATEMFRTISSVCAFWKMLYRAHEQLQNHGMVKQRPLKRLILRYWMAMIIFFVYIILSELYNYYATNSIQTKMFALYFFGLRALLHLKEQQLLYASIMLNFYLRAASDLLDHHVELLGYARMMKSLRYLEFLTRRIRNLKLLHSNLFQAGVELNRSFGWTYLILYCKNFIQILSNSYWVVFWVVNGQSDHALRIFSRLFIRFMLLFMIFHINNMVMMSGNHIQNQLNMIDLKMQIECRSLSVMLESFILQTRLEHIKLTAADCLVMNYKPILTIVITVCAYISLFIQQAPKSELVLKCYHRTDKC